MRKFSRESFNITEAINELMHESGVIVIENAYNLKDIKAGREIVYYFADTHIAEGPSSNWSFPNWPSHLDHILITNEIFEFEPDSITTTTLRLDDNMLGGWAKYDDYISDHRPMGIKLSNFMNLAPTQ